MRRLLGTSMLCIVLFAAGGCGDDDDANPDAGGSDAQNGGSAAQGNTVPECPFTEQEVIDLVGQPMTAEENCLFGDGKGVASLTITMASELAGDAAYDLSREQAEGSYGSVEDLDVDGKGYVSAGELGGEAVAITEAGSYTMIMSSFERFDPAGYEKTLRSLIDAALAK